MRVIALDTTTPLASLAAVEDGLLHAEIALRTRRGHSGHLLEGLKHILDRLGWSPNEADLFVASAGPGSFTGLRIGLGTVRGLAAAARRPAAGVSTLRALAAALGAPGVRIAPVRDAGRGEVYTGLFTGGDPPEPLAEEAVMAPEDVGGFIRRGESAQGGESENSGPVWVLGEGATRYRDRLDLPSNARLLNWGAPLAGATARLAWRLAEAGKSPAQFPLTARYIRPSDARLPETH